MEKYVIVVGVVGVFLVCSPSLQAVTMEWVTVGDAGNVDDTHGAGYGGVAYNYCIGKYEVT
ncbi:MAG: hypothetical protein ACYSR9_13675, partial [Planctomycetota bacterium]